MMRRFLFATLLPVVLVAAPVHGQSLFSGIGLGIPGNPVDARTRALGQVGPALPGWHVVSRDPAAAGGVDLPALSFTLQTSAADLGEGRVFGESRFPHVAVSYPLGWNVFFLEVGSYLQQDWRGERFEVLNLGEVSGRATDAFTSSGGVSRVQFGWSRRLIRTLSVGVHAGRYIGSIDRNFRRTIDGTEIGQGVESYSVTGAWKASGTVAGAGFIYDPSPLLRIGGSVVWSGNLRLTPDEGTESGTREYRMPLELRGGAAVTLTPGLALLLGGSYANWTETRADLAQPYNDDRASITYGAGIEFSNLTLLRRRIPLRIGARHQDLPFAYSSEGGSEQSVSAGFGVELAEGIEFPRAVADLAVERGTRSGGFTSSESFWRFSISMRIAGS